jgi:hypothetical protein
MAEVFHYFNWLKMLSCFLFLVDLLVLGATFFWGFILGSFFSSCLVGSLGATSVLVGRLPAKPRTALFST